MPEGLETIGYYAFKGCKSLKEIVIPESVKTLQHFAFESCGELVIYCHAQSAPEGWQKDWCNSKEVTVVWGYNSN